VPFPLQWQEGVVPQHLEVIQTAHTRFDFLPHAVQRVYGVTLPLPAVHTALLAPLATGGAMAVYKLTVSLAEATSYHLVCKIPHARRIVYAEGTHQQTTDGSTHQLLTRLVALADHLAQHAPGLFPRCGGLWHWQRADGTSQHLLVEEFIPGVSVERLKHRYESQLTAGHLTPVSYTQQRTAVERLAIATFIRLWHALGRHTFTSDPSPWNILVQESLAEPPAPLTATIIDLHSLEENVRFGYVVQRLAAVYGMRQDIMEHVLLPGILDALGAEAGRALLHAELPWLEEEAARSRQNLGVDMQRPLLTAIRRLCSGERGVHGG
jgi:hypothetical protein